MRSLNARQRQDLCEVGMSAARNRSGKGHGVHRGPRLTPRFLVDDLQGARDALIAFDGYEPSGTTSLASALQRPSAGEPTLVPRGLFSAIINGFLRWSDRLRRRPDR